MVRGDGVEEREVDDGSFMVVDDGTNVGRGNVAGHVGGEAGF